MDKSKYLDTQELAEVIKAYYKLEGVSRPLITAIVEVESAIKRYDVDGSGTLQFHEFIAMFCDVSPDAVFKFRIPAETRKAVYRLVMR